MSRTIPPTNTAEEVPFAANGIRLSLREWAVVAGILLVVSLSLPGLWRSIEPFDPGPDYRMPYDLGRDYWTFQRYCEQTAAEDKTLLIGDSVVWGHYVPAGETLSDHLNGLLGEDRFANLGVDGIEPAALTGLLEQYGRSITGKDVVLHCNLLWMSDPQRDLQTTKQRPINHPRLLPQLSTQIPCYKAKLSERLAVTIEHKVPLFAWARHLREAYFGSQSMPEWSLDHPYESPAGAVTLELPSPVPTPMRPEDCRPWHERGARSTPPWVELESSLQWRFFRQSVEILRARGNRVLVVVGPLNEHMFAAKPESLQAYAAMKQEVEAWLKAEGLPYCFPAPLPSDDYADTSHPLDVGYARLAERLLQDDVFVEFAEVEQ